ncbi:MAG: NAD-binding protein [Acidobacteria bacterium]|nr:NAD-binding protein [Acidobacteriota bacterium]
MKIIVIGYGRVGSQFVRKVDTAVHQVVVIDKERSVLERTEPPRGVKFLYGNAIDEDLLREAGAETADVMLALTREENTNLMIAQIARVVFNVPKVIAIVYDPQRESYFHQAGIETLAITVAGADLLTARLTGAAATLSESAEAWGAGATAISQMPLRPLEAHDGSFYVLIVGGGLVGYYLARALLRLGHEVTIIEKDSAMYDVVSQQVDCPVVLGDGSATAVLERAGASRANLLCAVTNHDQDNLIACQMAKFWFGVPKTIARVKNPKNEMVMRRLGVDTTVSSTAIITGVIQNELPATPVLTLANLASCAANIMQFRLDSQSAAIGKQASMVGLPSQCKIIGIIRCGEALTSLDSTMFETGDTVLAFVPEVQEAAVREILLGIKATVGEFERALKR